MEEPRRGAQRKRRPEWVDDARLACRWVEVRTTLARVGSGEYLGKTADISRQGVRLALNRGSASPGDEVRLTVIFDQGPRDLQGRVVHCQPRSWGSLVGIRFGEEDPSTQAFLDQHYPPTPPDDGAFL